MIFFLYYYNINLIIKLYFIKSYYKLYRLIYIRTYNNYLLYFTLFINIISYYYFLYPKMKILSNTTQ